MMNKKELEAIALQICEDHKSVIMTKREFINALGCEKRTSGNLVYIDDWLQSHNLTTHPDYSEGLIDENMELVFKYEIKSNSFQLYHLYIDKYKNLKDFDVDFYDTEHLCCFIGLNGSGKSNVLEAISAIFYSLYHIATLADGYRKYQCEFSYVIKYVLNGDFYEISNGRLRDGRKITLEMLPKNIIASYSGEDTRLWKKYYKPMYERYCSRMTAIQGFAPPSMFYISKYEWAIALLTLLYSEDIDVKQFVQSILNTDKCRIYFDYDVTNIKKWEGTADIEALIEKLREYRDFTIETFRDLINSISFIDQASTLFYYLYKLSTESESQVIRKVYIEFGENWTVDDLSEGEKKMIIANTVIHILSTKDSLCLFDEPDSHIHVGRKEELARLFDTENRYSVVTTHSPVLLKKIDDESIRVLKSGHIESMEKLQQINVLSGGEINYIDGTFILNSKKILVVEGKFDDKYLKKAIGVFAKKDAKYNKLYDITIFSANSASAAETVYNQILEPCINNIEQLVFLFDYDDGGWKDGWVKIRAIHDKNSKIIPLFYQDSYSSTLYPTSDIDVENANGSKCIKNENSFIVEDLFSEDSYTLLISPVISARKHKDFRKLPFGKKGTAGAIKEHIEKNYNTFKDEWYEGFKPVLDKLIEVFNL